MWRHQQSQDHRWTPPEKMSRPLLRAILAEHGILQQGCRELQEWRLRQYRAGLPVCKTIFYEPNLRRPRFLLFPYDLRGLPRDIVQYLILPQLAVEDLFALLLTCKGLTGIVHAELTARARSVFNIEQATPIAFSLLRRLKSCQFDHEKGDLLKITYLRHLPDESIIRVAILRHGYLDHLRQYPAVMARRKEARRLEDEFIASHRTERLAEVQNCLDDNGYHFLRMDNMDTKTKQGLHAMNDWAYIIELEEYVRMCQTRKIEKIIGYMKPPLIMRTVLNLDTSTITGRQIISFSYMLNELRKQWDLTAWETVKFVLYIYDMCRKPTAFLFKPLKIVWNDDYTITTHTI